MNRQKVFNGRLLKVFSSVKKLPTGKKTFIEEIDHPGASIVIPCIDKKIVFIRQYRPVINKYIWELPAGTINSGESPYSCAKREVTEETGYIVKDIKKLGYIYTTPGFCNEKIHIFKAICKELGPVSRDEDEIIYVRLLSKPEIIRKFRSGNINDSKTISALTFAGIL